MDGEGKIALITGVNGYIASTLGLLVLQHGYRLRGTARSRAKAQPLLDGPYAPFRDRVELFMISDMTAEGAFDQAVSGVHIIFHVASPVAFHLHAIEEVVEPAVKATENLLYSALHRAGPQLEAVVVTSSGAAMIRPNPPSGTIFTENDTNTFASRLAETGAGDLPVTQRGYAMYSASKVAADRAMWRFHCEKQPSFSMTSIHPAVVLGPAPVFPEFPNDLPEGLRPLYTVWAGTSDSMPPPIGTSSYVDVRDVAEMHLWAATHGEIANGQRYLASAGYGPAQAFADILKERFPQDDRIVVGTRGEGYVSGTDFNGRRTDVWYPPERAQISGKKIVQHMNIRLKTLEESVVDTVNVWRQIYNKT